MPTDRPQHDLLLARDFPPMTGGIARWMAALADGYPPGTLTVSTGAVPGASAVDGLSPQHIDRVAVPVDRLSTLLGVLRWSRRGIALAGGSAARFAWCDTIRPAGYAAHWIWRRTGLPYGIMVVGNDLLTLRSKIVRSRLRRRTMRRILGEATAFVAISEWTANECRAVLDLLDLSSAAARIRVVPLGTDSDRMRADPVAGIAFRKRRSLPDGRWLVTVARLVGYKGIDSGIHLVARLCTDYPDLHYAVVGRGPEQDRLRGLANELGVAARVHLLNDVDDAELPAAYSIGSLYLGLTRETMIDVEGFGISFAEAAACGLPVVAARSGGIPDAVVDGVTGTLVDPLNLHDAERSIRRLLDGPDLARRMGAAGRERVELYLNWGRVVTEMRAIAAEAVHR